MPITFSQIAANTAKTEFIYAGETVNLVYCPSNLTDSVIDAMVHVQNNPKSLIANKDAINEIVLHLVKSWDVLQDDETPYPIDPEHVGLLPLEFKLMAVWSMIENMRPKAEEQTGT